MVTIYRTTHYLTLSSHRQSCPSNWEKQGACSKSRWRTCTLTHHTCKIFTFLFLDCTRQQRKLLVLMCFVCLWIWLHWLDRQTFCTPFTPALSSSDTRQRVTWGVREKLSMNYRCMWTKRVQHRHVCAHTHAYEKYVTFKLFRSPLNVKQGIMTMQPDNKNQRCDVTSSLKQVTGLSTQKEKMQQSQQFKWTDMKFII